MSHSFFIIHVNFFLFTDPGVNETQSITDAAKPSVKKTNTSKPASKKQMFKDTLFLTVHP